MRLFLLLLLPLAAQAQPLTVADDFSDGDFATNPPWTGDADRWTVADTTGADLALRLAGVAARDTAALATASAAAYGTWRFRVGWRGVNLSTSSGMRVYLTSTASDLTAPTQGYYLQMGTNNAAQIRLYRQDGAPPDRTEIGRSGDLLVDGDQTLDIEVTRNQSGWSVRVDGAPAFEATDDTYRRSAALGVWAKYAATSNRGFLLDNVDVLGAAGPPGTRAPTVAGARYDAIEGGFEVAFGEPVRRSDVTASAFALTPGAVAAVTPRPGSGEADGAFVATGALPGGTYLLSVGGLRDAAGNALADTTLTLTIASDRPPPGPGEVVVNEFMAAPAAGGPEYVELLNVTDGALSLAGVTLRDGSSAAPRTLTDADLPPGGYAVVAGDTAALRARFPGGFAGALVVERALPALNNGGDRIVLAFGGSPIDSVGYAGGHVETGVALERVDPRVPGAASNFALSSDPAGGTPGRRNSRFALDDAPPRLVTLRATPGALRLTFSEVIPDACAAGYALEPIAADAPSVRIASCAAAADTARLALAPDLPRAAAYRLAVIGLTDAAGNVQPRQEAQVLIGNAPRAGELVVNEFLAAPATTDGAEFVEVLNASGAPVSLEGVALADSGEPRPLSSAATLDAGAYLVLTPDTAALRTQFPDGFADALVVEQAPWPALNNGGDRVALVAGGLVLDSVRYAAGQVERGVSAERVDPRVPGVASNFALSSDPAGGTPGRRNSRFAPDLDRPRVVRAYYRAADTVAVRFSEPVTGGVLTVEGAALDARAGGSLVVAPAPPEADRIGVAGWRDLRGNPLEPTSAGLAQRPGALVIGEILFAPRAGDDAAPQPEYVEIANPSDRPVTLSGLALTGAPLDEPERADTTRLASEQTIPPRGFALVYDADADGPPDARLRAAFPDLDTTAVRIGVGSVTSGGLRNAGERLVLLDTATGQEVDVVPYRDDWTDANRASTTGLSLEKLDLAAPSDDPLSWASARAAEGGTPTRPSSVRRDPSARAPQPGEVRITEVLFAPSRSSDDGLPDQTDLFEIYNASPDPLALNGLLLLSAPDENGAADTLRLVYAPQTLDPGAYAAVYAVSGIYAERRDPDAQLRTAFPDADGLLLGQRRSLSLPDDGRLLHLVGPGGATLDSVRYDPGWHNPAVRDGTGLSLEKIDPLAASASASSWSTSASPRGATPARRNSLTPDADAPGPSRPGVTVTPSPFSPDGDGFDDAATIRYRLRATSASVRVRIFDHRGRLVRELRRVALAGQTGTLAWDGYGDDGRALRIGLYVVHLEAVGPDGSVEQHRGVVALARPL